MSNKYLEKVASLRNAKHMAGAALDIAKKNPMTAAFGVAGSMEGGLSTTKQPREGTTRYGLRAVKNTIVGGAKGAAAGKALELGYQHLKIKAVERSGNQYLHKAATTMDATKKLAHGVGKAWEETPGPTRLSLGIGAASLGVGTANFMSSQRRAARQAKQNDLEQKSLNALQGIRKAIVQQSE